MLHIFYFFFSSRRRHTRFDCDWSSDVCSSDLMELQRRLGTTFIIVTHDQEEAMTVASRIGVMDSGRLEQVATPRELYEAPHSRWIAEFVGDVNMFDGRVASREASRLRISTKDAGTIV